MVFAGLEVQTLYWGVVCCMEKFIIATRHGPFDRGGFGVVWTFLEHVQVSVSDNRRGGI